MRYDTECREAAERLFKRIHGHLLAIRDTFNLPIANGAIADENNALLDALEAGDPIYDIDHDRDVGE